MFSWLLLLRVFPRSQWRQHCRHTGLWCCSIGPFEGVWLLTSATARDSFPVKQLILLTINLKSRNLIFFSFAFIYSYNSKQHFVNVLLQRIPRTLELTLKTGAIAHYQNKNKCLLRLQRFIYVAVTCCMFQAKFFSFLFAKYVSLNRMLFWLFFLDYLDLTEIQRTKKENEMILSRCLF